MVTGEQLLTEFIRARIRERGAVPFEWFMEQALYHPDLGYYSSGRCSIGRRGDYFTNVSVGPLFGQMLAAQFAEMWEALGRPDNFVIVEQGAHHGDFARDVLGTVRAQIPAFFSALRYCIIEPIPLLRQRQAETLRDFLRTLTWRESMTDLEPFCGVHFSNELLDAMPVHLISRVGGEWQERCVTESGDGFDFVTTPISDVRLRQHLNAIPEHLTEPYETEVNLAALRWVKSLAAKLQRGFVLVADYGYARDQYYSPERSSGTLRCYAHHRLISSPFFEIGHTDITAHVDWTGIAIEAEAHGFDLAGFADQHHFLTGVATALMPDQFEAPANPATRRALQTLIHPEVLGTTFQFLALAKNAGSDVRLSGFKFARDPRRALGL